MKPRAKFEAQKARYLPSTVVADTAKELLNAAPAIDDLISVGKCPDELDGWLVYIEEGERGMGLSRDSSRVAL